MTTASAPLPTQRADLLARLAQPHHYDLAVIGGGATGLGVALDAAARGFSVVLVDSHDFAKGTSSRATKLVHGGVRYLAQGNIALVREALHERTTLLHNAPHLAQPLPFVMPSYRFWETPFYGIGLMMYDALAGKAGLGATQFLGRARTLACLPTARTDEASHGANRLARVWPHAIEQRLREAVRDQHTPADSFRHLPAFEVREAGNGERAAEGPQAAGADRLHRQLRRRTVVLVPADRRGEHALAGGYEQNADQGRYTGGCEDELHIDEERGAAAVVDARLDPLGEERPEEAVRGA